MKKFILAFAVLCLIFSGKLVANQDSDATRFEKTKKTQENAGNFLVAALVAEAKMGLMRHKNAGIILTDDRKRGRKTDDGNRAVRTVPKRTDPSGEHSVLSAGVAQRAEEGRAGDPADRGPGHGPMPPPVRRADVPRHPVAGAELG